MLLTSLLQVNGSLSSKSCLLSSHCFTRAGALFASSQDNDTDSSCDPPLLGVSAPNPVPYTRMLTSLKHHLHLLKSLFSGIQVYPWSAGLNPYFHSTSRRTSHPTLHPASLVHSLTPGLLTLCCPACWSYQSTSPVSVASCLQVLPTCPGLLSASSFPQSCHRSSPQQHALWTRMELLDTRKG